MAAVDPPKDGVLELKIPKNSGKISQNPSLRKSSQAAKNDPRIYKKDNLGIPWAPRLLDGCRAKPGTWPPGSLNFGDEHVRNFGQSVSYTGGTTSKWVMPHLMYPNVLTFGACSDKPKWNKGHQGTVWCGIKGRTWPRSSAGICSRGASRSNRVWIIYINIYIL